jgi:hypothetical protein
MRSATTRRRVVLPIVCVLITVAAVGFGLQAAGSKLSVAAPIITSKPANPTARTSASFQFTGPCGATLFCQLDAASFAPCESPKNYAGPLAQGPHTFRVKAVAGSAQSAATSYTWTVDTAAPPAPSITAKPASLSTTTSASLSFTDSESAVAFRCTIDLSASAACSSPRTYSKLSHGAHSFGVQAVDAAGKRSDSTTWSWSIDSLAPPAPVLTTEPTDPTYNATNNLAWSDSEAGVSFQCSLENGAWEACSTPYTYVIATSNYGQHQFAVRAVDGAGNVSAARSYQFKYEKGLATSGLPFQITGTVKGLTLGVWKPIAVRISNSNGVVMYVRALNVTVAADSSSSGCLNSANIVLQQSNVSTSLRVAVPANGSVVLPAQNAIAPQIRLKNLPAVNQNVCKNKSFSLSYSGTATS